MTILLVSKDTYDLEGVRCVRSFENIEWDTIDTLIFHSTSDEDMKVLYNLGAIRNMVSKVIYINRQINPLYYCIFTGLNADIYDSETYLEDMELVNFLVGSYKETGLTMKSADDSLEVLAKSIAAISSAPIEGLQKMLTNAYWTKSLTTAVSNLDRDISIVSKINIDVVEMMTETMKLIKDLEANNEKTDSELESLRATIRKMQEDIDTRVRTDEPSALYKFPQYNVPVNVNKVLYFKSYGHCRYLNSFVLAYRHYLEMMQNQKSRVLFIVPKLALQMKKFNGVGARLAQETISLIDYNTNVYVTYEPRKQVLDAFFSQQGVINFLVVDLTFGDSLLRGHMVKEFYGVGSLSEMEFFKLEPTRTILPIVAKQNNILLKHISAYSRANESGRRNLYFSDNKDAFERVGELSK